MRKLLTEILNCIFPPRDTEKTIQNARLEETEIFLEVGQCESTSYLSDYQKPLVRAAIIENKFHGNDSATQMLADLLAKWIVIQHKKTLYVPIPLGPKRLKSRGYNQVSRILRKIKIDIDIGEDVILRPTDTKQQAQINKKERLKNMDNAFIYIGDKINWSDFSQVVIIDDVITTGATMKAARASLAPHLPPNIKLICLALAH